jgi:transcriptional regulator of arginine metabolism
MPGMAQAAAAAIDGLEWKEIVGSIAGDDTIMVVVRTPDSAPEIIGRIRSISRTAH